MRVEMRQPLKDRTFYNKNNHSENRLPPSSDNSKQNKQKQFDSEELNAQKISMDYPKTARQRNVEDEIERWQHKDKPSYTSREKGLQSDREVVSLASKRSERSPKNRTESSADYQTLKKPTTSCIDQPNEFKNYPREVLKDYCKNDASPTLVKKFLFSSHLNLIFRTGYRKVEGFIS